MDFHPKQERSASQRRTQNAADVPRGDVEIRQGVDTSARACEVVAIFQANFHDSVQTLGLVEVT